MTFWEEFALVFSEIGWIPAICLIVGLILIMIEIFEPGFGFFGITGAVLVAVGIAVRIYKSGGGNPIIQLVILVGMVAIIVCLAIIIMVWSMRNGWMSRTAFVQKSTAVSTEHSEGTLDFRTLIGKEGITACDLRPIGVAEIDGNRYDVVSDSNFIIKDTPVVVCEVEGVKIVVKEKK